MSGCKLLDRCRLEEHRAVGSSALHEDALRESQNIVDISEQARVSRDSAENKAVFVLHFALDHTSAKGLVVLSWGNPGTALFGWTKMGRREAEGGENFPSAKCFERLAGEHFNDFAEQNVAEVGIFRPHAWLRLKGKL